MNEFEEREKVAQEELKKAKDSLSAVEQTIKGIESCYWFKFSPDLLDSSPALSKESLRWLDQVEALGLVDINAYIKNNLVREIFTIPHPMVVVGPQSIYQHVANLKQSLANSLSFYQIDRNTASGNIPGLEEKLRVAKFDRLTIEHGESSVKFSKESVDLTTINIAVAVGVPVIILFITLIGTISFEAFKPEILNWMRHVFGLLPLSK
jgi:hypothetical protein